MAASVAGSQYMAESVAGSQYMAESVTGSQCMAESAAEKPASVKILALLIINEKHLPIFASGT